jgi:hypothetical protein
MVKGGDVRSYWVFNIGTAEDPPDEDWLAAWRHHTEEMWFTPNKKPTGVRPGDRAVMHGSGGRGFFAVIEVTSREPEPNRAEKLEDRKRWPWIVRYKLLVAIRADEHAPSREDIDWPNPKSLRRNPHVRIDRDTYERISAAIVEGAAEAVGA